MLFVDSDFIDDDSSFDTALRRGDRGKIFLRAYATSGALMGTPHPILWHGSGYAATAMNASLQAALGIPEKTVASGCVGWFTIRGYVPDAQGAATSFLGSYGHAVYWGGATGIGCSASAWNGVASQIGILMEDLGAAAGSTTANIWLTGNTRGLSI